MHFGTAEKPTTDDDDIVWAYVHLNFCGGLRKTHLFCSRLLIGRSGSLKVVDFGTNR